LSERIPEKHRALNLKAFESGISLALSLGAGEAERSFP
jgi:hypothetical protein